MASCVGRLTHVLLSQVAICVLHMQRTFVDEGWFSVLVASQQVLLWMKLVSAHGRCVSRGRGWQVVPSHVCWYPFKSTLPDCVVPPPTLRADT